MWKLNDAVIREWDEARHGVNAYEMLREGEMVVSTWNDETDYWNLKPPLSYWLIMASYKLFGFSPFSMRFYSAVSYILTAIITALAVKRRHGEIPSLVLLLLFAANRLMLFTHMARRGDADALYVLLFTVAVLLTIRYTETKDPKPLYGACLAFAFAFLDKSWHSGCIPAVMFFILICGNGFRGLNLKRVLICLLAALGPVLIWAVVRYRRDGMIFFQQMIAYDLMNRSANAIEGHTGGFGYYLKMLLMDVSSLLLLLLAGSGCLATFVRHIKKPHRPSLWTMALLIWFLLPFGMFSLVRTKLYWYVFPGIIPLLIAAAVVIGRLFESKRFRIVAVGAVVCVLAICVQNFTYIYQGGGELAGGDVYGALACTSREGGYAGGICYVAEGDWRQHEVLLAELRGNLHCRNGGIDAFRTAANGDTPTFLLINANDLSAPELLAAHETIYENNGYILIQ
ncbi:MAG: glycosyltransferase family 39 protein [Clostridia bacterium]|nr:glycosyltransferase family 39 protein [Clostridia bacterium]